MIILDGHTFTLKQLKAIAKRQDQVAISDTCIQRIHEASTYVEHMVSGKKPIYGINTGFGHLAHVMIDDSKLEQLQLNLLMSHACGMGDVLPIETVRAMMALRVNALIQGYSGIRLETIEHLLKLLNEDMIPVVFEQGSLGASGDLALLSHMSLPLLGLGEVFLHGERMPSSKAYAILKLQPLEKLYPKEGLSLINGTQAMCAIGGLVLEDAFKLLRFANLAVSMTMEALEGITDAFDPKIQHLRRHQGQIIMAQEILRMLQGSQNVICHDSKRVQDAYSLRCVPQVHGAIYDTLHHVLSVLENEMNAVTDNPLIFVEEKEILSAGNFHGEPLAFAFDYLGIALAEIASISERRIERMVNPQLNNGLPAFLARDSGLNSGFMIAQYTAASLVSENKVLAHPASVDSIPSSANQEDHVSMGSISARKARTILSNSRKVIALELFCAFQALHFRPKNQCGEITQHAYQLLENEIPFIEKDEVLYPYMHRIESLITDDAFYQALFKGDDLNE